MDQRRIPPYSGYTSPNFTQSPPGTAPSAGNVQARPNFTIPGGGGGAPTGGAAPGVSDAEWNRAKPVYGTGERVTEVPKGPGRGYRAGSAVRRTFDKAVNSPVLRGATVLGGVVEAADRGSQAVTDFQNGDNLAGAYNTVRAASGVGTAKFNPLAMAFTGGSMVGDQISRSLSDETNNTIGRSINSVVRGAGKLFGKDWGVDDTALRNMDGVPPATPTAAPAAAAPAAAAPAAAAPAAAAPPTTPAPAPTTAPTNVPTDNKIKVTRQENGNLMFSGGPNASGLDVGDSGFKPSGAGVNTMSSAAFMSGSPSTQAAVGAARDAAFARGDLDAVARSFGQGGGLRSGGGGVNLTAPAPAAREVGMERLRQAVSRPNVNARLIRDLAQLETGRFTNAADNSTSRANTESKNATDRANNQDSNAMARENSLRSERGAAARAQQTQNNWELDFGLKLGKEARDARESGDREVLGRIEGMLPLTGDPAKDGPMKAEAARALNMQYATTIKQLEADLQKNPDDKNTAAQLKRLREQGLSAMAGNEESLLKHMLGKEVAAKGAQDASWYNPFSSSMPKTSGSPVASIDAFEDSVLPWHDGYAHGTNSAGEKVKLRRDLLTPEELQMLSTQRN